MHFVLKKPHKSLPDKTTGTDTCRTEEEVVSVKKVQFRIVLLLQNFLRILRRIRNRTVKLSLCLYILQVLSFELFFLCGKTTLKHTGQKKMTKTCKLSSCIT